MAVLTPFYRDGKPVDLTVSDYATKTGLTHHKARGALVRLMRAGLIRRSYVRNCAIFAVRQP